MKDVKIEVIIYSFMAFSDENIMRIDVRRLTSDGQILVKYCLQSPPSRGGIVLAWQAGAMGSAKWWRGCVSF